MLGRFGQVPDFGPKGLIKVKTKSSLKAIKAIKVAGVTAAVATVGAVAYIFGSPDTDDSMSSSLFGYAERDQVVRHINDGGGFYVINGALYDADKDIAYIRPIVRRANGKLDCEKGTDATLDPGDIIYHPSDGGDKFPYHLNINELELVTVYGGTDPQGPSTVPVQLLCTGSFMGNPVAEVIPRSIVYESDGYVWDVKIDQTVENATPESLMQELSTF